MTASHSAPTSPANDEPETPAWLPALGFVLLVAVGLTWAVTPPTAQAGGPLPAGSAKASEPASANADAVRRAIPPPTPPAAQVQAAMPTPPARPAPTASVAAHDKVARPAKKHPQTP